MSSFSKKQRFEEGDNVTRCWQWNQIDSNPPKCENAKRILENAAEDHLVNKETLDERSCEVPGTPKSTFLMVFSPDGTKVASTHGNHHIYLSELSTGKHVKTLIGHPRTPWCIAFHPSRARLLASGCLGGEVRVWDLDGGSEVWSVENEIASLAFHPHDQMLVIASYNELFFWDWKNANPYIKVRTDSIKEKVRFVAFDPLGHKLITGIAIKNTHPASLLNTNNSSNVPNPTNSNNTTNNNNQGGDNDDAPVPPPNRSAAESQSTYERLFRSYDNLMNQYRQLLGDAPVPSNTTDRGTDPMDVEQMHYVPPIRGNVPRTSQPVVVRRIPFFVQHHYYSENVNRPNVPQPDQQPPNNEYISMHHNPNLAPPPRLNQRPSEDRSSLDRLEALFVASTSSSPSTARIPLHNRLAQLFRSTPPRPGSNREEPESPPEPSLPTSNSGPSDRTGSSNNPAPTFAQLVLRVDNNNDDESSFLPSAFLPLSGPRQEERSENIRHAHVRYVNLRDLTNPLRINPHNNRQTEAPGSVILPPFRNSAIRTARDEFAASLHRIQGLVETSIDDTFNYWDRYVNGPRPSSMEVLREFPTRRPNNTTANTSNSNINPNDTANSSARTSIGRFNLDRHSHEENPGRRDLRIDAGNEEDPFREMTMMIVNSIASLDAAAGNPTRERPPRLLTSDVDINNFFSSDDDSDGDRDMFSPLPRVPPHRSSPSTANLSQSIVQALFPPQSSSGTTSGRTRNEVPVSNRTATRPFPLYNPSRNTDTSSNRLDNIDVSVNLNPQNEDHQYSMRNTNNDDDIFNIIDQYLLDRNDSANSDQDIGNIFNDIPGTNQQPEDVQYVESDPAAISCAAFQKVTSGVKFLEKHTEKLASLLSNNQSRPPIEQLRQLWEDLSTDMIALDMTESAVPEYFSNFSQSQSGSSNLDDINMPSTSTGITHPQNSQPEQSTSSTRSASVSKSRMLKRKLHLLILNVVNTDKSNKTINLMQNTMNEKMKINANSLKTPQQNDVTLIRGLIRIQARLILSFIFTLMMHCLDVEALGNLIVVMLRSMKKALSISCVLLLPTGNTASSSEADNENNSEEEFEEEDSSRLNSSELAGASLTGVTSDWSDRIAVQIASVNRNNSEIANSRREVFNRMCSSWRTSLINSNFSQRQRKKRSLKMKVNIGKRLKLNTPMPSTSNANAAGSSSGSTLPRFATSQHRPVPRTRGFPPPFRRSVITPVPPRNRNPLPTSPLAAERRLERDPNIVRRLLFIRNREYRLNIRRNALTLHRESLHRWIPGQGNVVVPSVRVNDVPVSEVNQNAAPEAAPRIRLPSRFAEFVHPVFVPNLVLGDDNIGIGIIDPGMHSSYENHPTSRIQVWNFSEGEVPDIRNSTKNVVVPQCKILNDASVDISKDGRLLVALLPPPQNTRGYGSLSHRLVLHSVGIYSLEWGCLGACLYYTLLEQNAVSVSLSPCARHLAVGLSTKRINLQPFGRNGIMALIFRLGNPMPKKDAEGNGGTGGLIPVRTLEQNSEASFTSLNCLRWAPQPGQGLLYANNMGQLKILS